MEPLTKNRFLLLGVLLTALSIVTPVFANSDIVSPSDAQHFEQTYEDWAKSIIKSLNPKLDFTVLSQVEFSRNPEHVQEYEDMKATNHLPGLPDVADPSYTNPLESPLYALVAKKNFKIIVYAPLSSRELDLLREVLNNKLKLSADDTLNFEYVNRETLNPTPTKTTSPFHATRKAIATLIAGLMLLAGAAVSIRKKQSFRQLFKATKKWIMNYKTKSIALNPPKVNPTLSPGHQIQAASPAALRKVLETEKADLIARASLNATKRFSNRLLGECDQNKFDLVIQWINANHKNVNHQDSNYARLLIAARLQQVQNDFVLNSIDQFNRIREMKAKLQTTKMVKVKSFVRRPEVKEAKL